jgi:hypothetical protein
VRMGSMSYQGEAYLGIEGVLENSHDIDKPRNQKIFRVDRIIDFIPSHSDAAEESENHHVKKVNLEEVREP